MFDTPNTTMVIIGHPHLVGPINDALPGRGLGVPFAPLETYPAAMCLFDIALAPAGDDAWYRGKSDLRWLEAAALKLPVIASPRIYPEIEHGVTGFHAAEPKDVEPILRELVADADLRRRVGQLAYDHVAAERSSETAAMQWSEVLSAVHGGYESVHQLKRPKKGKR
jgi:glycosyltransferase involved in cell wall biosynthesis